MRSQNTLKSEVYLKGTGIHSGQEVSLTLQPAAQNTGIRFQRTDLENEEVHAALGNSIDASRCTILKENGVEIKTPEHLLAACYGLGIDNLIVKISGEECPILDGSAKSFADAIVEAGVLPQAGMVKPININSPMVLEKGAAKVIGLPNETPQFTFIIDYPDSFIGCQAYTFFPQKDDFLQDLAPARTYGFEHEVKALLESGLAKGGSLDNAVVIGEKDYLNPTRFENECVRHKCLDLIGDFSLLGVLGQGHVIGFGSGHALHHGFSKKLNESFL